MKRSFINLLAVVCLFYPLNMNGDTWETIIPSAWKDVPDRLEFTGGCVRHVDYMTGQNPLTGNVTIPPYVIERKEGDRFGGIMTVKAISGGIHPGWIAHQPRRIGYSENGDLSAPPGMNTNYYGTFYQANIDTLRLPPTIEKINSLAFEKANVKVLICTSSTPPSLGQDIIATSKLIVPTGCLSVYQQANHWQSFAVIEEGAEKYMPEQYIINDGALYQLRDNGTAMLVICDKGELIIPDYLDVLGKQYAVTQLGNSSINKYGVGRVTLGAKIEHFDQSNLQDTYFDKPSFVAGDYNEVALTEINVSPNNPYYSSFNGALYTKDGTKLLFFPKIKKNRAIGDVYTIPDGVITIGKNAFPKYYDYNLRIYDNLYNINVIIPPSVTLIEEQDIEIGYNFIMTTEYPPTTENSVFKGYVGVPVGCLYNYLDVQPYSQFNVKEIKSINGLYSLAEIPINEVFLNDDIFFAYWHHDGQYYELKKYTTTDTEVTIPSSISYGLMTGPIKILKGFSTTNRGEVQSLTIPEGIEEIGLSGLSILRSIFLPQSLKKIDISGFSGCTYLQSIILPKNVKSIGRYVFSGCSSLINVCVESATPPEFFATSTSNTITWSYTDMGLPNRAILHVPVGSKTAYENHPVWGGFTFIVDDMPADLADINIVRSNSGSFRIQDLHGRVIRHESTSLEGLSSGIYLVNGKKVVIK